MLKTKETSIEVVRQVHFLPEGVCLEIGPDREGLDLIELRTVGKANIDFYGPLRICLTHDMAKALAAALIASANEMRS